jgi:hypothetical protein
MIKGLYACVLAGTLVGVHIPPALGDDATARPDLIRGSQPRAQSPEQLQLPAVPHLDTVPWLNSSFTSRGAKVDFLLAPKFDTRGPFLAERIVPPVNMSLVAGSLGATAAVE